MNSEEQGNETEHEPEPSLESQESPEETSKEKKSTRRPSKRNRKPEAPPEPEKPKRLNLNEVFSVNLRKFRLFTWIRDLIVNLNSPDLATRWVSALCLFCGFVAVSFMTVTGIHVFKVYRENVLQREKLLAQQRKAQEEKESESERQRGNVLNLGSFLLELKPLSEDEGKSSAEPPANMAEVEVVLVCADSETRDYINDHLVQVKDHFSQILFPVSRSDILSTDGKRQLRDYLKKKLNEWLPKGEIKELYFPRMALG